MTGRARRMSQVTPAAPAIDQQPERRKALLHVGCVAFALNAEVPPDFPPLCGGICSSFFGCPVAGGSLAPRLRAEPSDPHLARLVAAWPMLPAAIRAAVLALLDSAER
jgi:hypothetical protein